LELGHSLVFQRKPVRILLSRVFEIAHISFFG